MSSKMIATLIAKLKAHADSAKAIGNEAEALAFAQKAMALADKHGIDFLEATTESEFVTFKWTQIKYYQKQYAAQVASLYGVAGILADSKKYSGTYMTLHGRQEAIDCVLALFDINEAPVKKAMNESMKKHNVVKQGHREKFRRDFYIGVAIGLKQSVERARDKYNSGLTEVMARETENSIADYQKDHATSTTRARKVGRTASNAGKQIAGKVKAGKMLGGTKLLN